MNRWIYVLLSGCLAVLLGGCAARTAEPVAVTEVETIQVQPVQTQPGQTEPLPPETTQPQPERFVLTFAGDCTLGATPSNYYAQLGFIKTVGEDYAYPFANVLDYFAGDDFTLVNLEGPLCDDGWPVPKKFNFRGPTDYVNILTDNAVEAVSLANNHTMDYGQRGYDETLATLEAAGVPYVEQDGGLLVTLERGLTIGMYGAMYTRLDQDTIAAGLADLREAGADVVLLVVHWGTEYSYQPTPEQQRLGRAAIDAGADMVIGSHPHVLQPVEFYNGGVICYSLGNFSFGGNTDPGDFDTALVQQEVFRDPDGTVRLGAFTAVPACVSSTQEVNNFQPTPYAPDSEAYSRVLEKLGLSQGTETGKIA